MKKPRAFHPLLFALFPILFLFSHNIREVSFPDTLPSLVVSLTLTSILFLSFRLLTKDTRKAALIVTLFLLLFFFYRSIYVTVRYVTLLRNRHLFPLFCMIFAFGSYYVIKTRKNLNIVTNFLNIVGCCLISISLINITIYEIKSVLGLGYKNYLNRQESDEPDFSESDILPDIYYIILDGYAASHILNDSFGYDNQRFIDFLKENNFYIASKSKANYMSTFPSLACSLNMEYVHYRKDVAAHPENRRLLVRLIKQGKVLRMLKGKGYTYVHFGGWWGATGSNPNADIEYKRYKYFTEFAQVLLRKTILAVFLDYYFPNIYRSSILFTFDKASHIPEMDQPTFAFIHVIAPHDPYVFGPDGTPVPVKLTLSKDPEIRKQLYVDQVTFINTKVENLIKTILKNSKNKPIIILQADHGWSLGVPIISVKYIKERMPIFNAYHFPQGGKDLLYESISPVNSFRLVFSYYFNEDWELLDDRSYFPLESESYELTDITALLN
jgi:hypothetical protein